MPPNSSADSATSEPFPLHRPARSGLHPQQSDDVWVTSCVEGIVVPEVMTMSSVQVEAPPMGINEVQLQGRLTAAAETVVLPSGDTVVVFRLSVPRAAGAAGGRSSRARFDWFDCQVWRGPARRAAQRWEAGDVVMVRGELRRRHFRHEGGVQSRVAVDVLAGHRVSRAGDPRQ